MAELVQDQELLAFLRSVAAGRERFLKLENGVDVDTLSPKDALMRGLPPRPVGGTPSFELWHALAISSTAKDVGPGPSTISAHRTGYNRSSSKGHLQTSRNWSGAVISSPYRGQPFDFMIGIWKVPDFRAPAHGVAGEYACSTWIGFDGHRRNSRSLPQLGTVQEIEEDVAGNVTKRVRAWWQWWHPADTTGPNYDDFSDFCPGIKERVIAALFVIPTIGVLMKMANLDTGAATKSVLVATPKPGLEPRALDAECVLERPKRVQHPFTNFMTPDFDDTTFRCYASVRGEPAIRDMQGARLIRMVHRQGSQVETIATPDPVQSREAVTVSYCLN
ncbi:G1 family glutamic endopeptidase [Bosea sp. BH3]|uniref:G1 family glutamic endopeptidase n=1 Tax=Bosea sp. BH3 TaxID=2871701 RepID=UPI0021CB5FE9|nr:G1 family glutamic endopeptidase [Bosea sp. BH3]MCU4181636.1 hypothetical protein [Bosea sp. BH3]